MAKWVSRYLLKACSRVCVGSVPVFSRPGAGKTQLFPFGIKDSANSGFRSLKFFFRSIAFFNPLIFIALQGGLENMKEKDVFGAFAGRSLFPFPFLPLSRFSPSLSFSLSLSSFSLYRSPRSRSPLALTFFRGRRQLPQAGEVRRPLVGARREVLVGSGWGGECLNK